MNDTIVSVDVVDFLCSLKNHEMDTFRGLKSNINVAQLLVLAVYKVTSKVNCFFTSGLDRIRFMVH